MNKWDWKPLVTPEEAIKLHAYINYSATIQISKTCWDAFLGEECMYMTARPGMFDALGAIFAAGYIQGRREMKAERRAQMKRRR